MIGQTLAHYEVLAKIGEGGMGEVYRARDTRLQRDVALKLLPADATAKPDRLVRFENEAKSIRPSSGWSGPTSSAIPAFSS